MTIIRRSVTWLALLFCASFQTLNLDAQININFDTDASGNAISAPAVFSLASPLTTLYAPLGITFSGPGAGLGGAILGESGSFGVLPMSGNNFLAFNPSTYAVGPETITFAKSMSSVYYKYSAPLELALGLCTDFASCRFKPSVDNSPSPGGEGRDEGGLSGAEARGPN